MTDVVKLMDGLIRTLNQRNRMLEDACGPVLRESANDQFAEGGDPDHWKPLAPSTIRQKASQGYPRRNRHGQIPLFAVQRGRFSPENILIRTGSLRDSLTNAQNPFHFCRADNNTLWFGTTLSYWVYHQSTQPRKKLPRRPIVVTSRTLEKCAAAMVVYIVNNSR